MKKDCKKNCIGETFTTVFKQTGTRSWIAYRNGKHFGDIFYLGPNYVCHYPMRNTELNDPDGLSDGKEFETVDDCQRWLSKIYNNWNPA